MKLKDFIKLLDAIIEKDPESMIQMYLAESKIDELYDLNEEWEHIKEYGEYFDIDIELLETEPHLLHISPIRYNKLLAMPPKGRKVYK